MMDFVFNTFLIDWRLFLFIFVVYYVIIMFKSGNGILVPLNILFILGFWNGGGGYFRSKVSEFDGVDFISNMSASVLPLKV